MSPILSRATATAVRPEPSWKNILAGAAIEVIEMMASTRLQPGTSADGKPSGDTTAIVGMAGALCGMTAIRCSRQSATKLAVNMLGGDAVTNPSTPGDALGELCNMVAGNFKAKFSSLADRCLLTVPTVIRGENYSMRHAEPFETIEVMLDLDGAPVWITLVV